MKTEYLQFFIATAETESISKAASRLHISQQGLSRIITLLEKEYGTQLLHRQGGSVHLTPAGIQLLEQSRAVVDSYERLKRHMQEVVAGASGHHPEQCSTIIYMTLNAIHHIYPHVADIIKSTFPHYSICVVEIDQQDLIPAIRDNTKPNVLFFVSVPMPTLIEYAAQKDIVFRPLIDTQLDIIAHRNSSLADKQLFTWKDLEDIPLILRKDPGMITLLKKRKVNGFPEKAHLWTTDTKAIEQSLERTEAVTFSTSFLGIYPDSERFIHIPIENTFRTPTGFIHKEGHELTPETNEVRKFIEICFANKYPKTLFNESSLVAKRWKPIKSTNGRP